MARIKCQTPSTGKPVNVTAAGVATSWATIAEAPDFSVPDTAARYPDRDSTDASRAIRPGELFFLTAMTAKNRDTVTRWVELRLLREDTSVVELGRISLPAGYSSSFAIQGRSLLKRVPAGANGDRLQARAQAGAVIDLWASAEEKLSAEHFGVVA